jgi:hypothetical protein
VTFRDLILALVDAFFFPVTCLFDDDQPGITRILAALILVALLALVFFW